MKATRMNPASHGSVAHAQVGSDLVDRQVAAEPLGRYGIRHRVLSGKVLETRVKVVRALGWASNLKADGDAGGKRARADSK